MPPLIILLYGFRSSVKDVINDERSKFQRCCKSGRSRAT